jgi:tripartite-type tricarboxylate transporter receptor subunit TctC
VVERVNAEFAKAVQLPEIRQVYAKVGAAPAASTPDAFAAHIRSEMAKLGKLVQLSGARID